MGAESVKSWWTKRSERCLYILVYSGILFGEAYDGNCKTRFGESPSLNTQLTLSP